MLSKFARTYGVVYNTRAVLNVVFGRFVSFLSPQSQQPLVVRCLINDHHLFISYCVSREPCPVDRTLKIQLLTV